MSWQDIYASPWQGVWGLVVVSALFLAWVAIAPRAAARGAEPAAAAFVRAWAVVFAIESICDATLPALAGVSMLPFVLLGDFRVFLLLEAVADPGRPLARHLLAAAAWTLFVPAVTAAVSLGWIAARGPLPGPVADVLAGATSSQALWLVYETAFVALATVLRQVVVPRRRPRASRYLRAVLAYVLAYYGLWALADVAILAGFDQGWLLRMLPNQLYYGLFVPFAYGLFFASAPPESAATSSRVQAAR